MKLFKNTLIIIAVCGIAPVAARPTGGAQPVRSNQPNQPAPEQKKSTMKDLLEQVRKMPANSVINADGTFVSSFTEFVRLSEVQPEFREALIQAGRNFHMPLKGNDTDLDLLDASNRNIMTFLDQNGIKTSNTPNVPDLKTPVAQKEITREMREQEMKRKAEEVKQRNLDRLAQNAFSKINSLNNVNEQFINRLKKDLEYAEVSDEMEMLTIMTHGLVTRFKQDTPQRKLIIEKIGAIVFGQPIPQSPQMNKQSNESAEQFTKRLVTENRNDIKALLFSIDKSNQIAFNKNKANQSDAQELIFSLVQNIISQYPETSTMDIVDLLGKAIQKLPFTLSADYKDIMNFVEGLLGKIEQKEIVPAPNKQQNQPAPQNIDIPAFYDNTNDSLKEDYMNNMIFDYLDQNPKANRNAIIDYAFGQIADDLARAWDKKGIKASSGLYTQTKGKISALVDKALAEKEKAKKNNPKPNPAPQAAIIEKVPYINGMSVSNFVKKLVQANANLIRSTLFINENGKFEYNESNENASTDVILNLANYIKSLKVYGTIKNQTIRTALFNGIIEEAVTPLKDNQKEKEKLVNFLVKTLPNS